MLYYIIIIILILILRDILKNDLKHNLKNINYYNTYLNIRDIYCVFFYEKNIVYFSFPFNT